MIGRLGTPAGARLSGPRGAAGSTHRRSRSYEAARGGGISTNKSGGGSPSAKVFLSRLFGIGNPTAGSGDGTAASHHEGESYHTSTDSSRDSDSGVSRGESFHSPTTAAAAPARNGGGGGGGGSAFARHHSNADGIGSGDNNSRRPRRDSRHHMTSGDLYGLRYSTYYDPRFRTDWEGAVLGVVAADTAATDGVGGEMTVTQAQPHGAGPRDSPSITVNTAAGGGGGSGSGAHHSRSPQQQQQLQGNAAGEGPAQPAGRRPRRIRPDENEISLERMMGLVSNDESMYTHSDYYASRAADFPVAAPDTAGGRRPQPQRRARHSAAGGAHPNGTGAHTAVVGNGGGSSNSNNTTAAAAGRRRARRAPHLTALSEAERQALVVPPICGLVLLTTGRERARQERLAERAAAAEAVTRHPTRPETNSRNNEGSGAAAHDRSGGDGGAHSDKKRQQPLHKTRRAEWSADYPYGTAEYIRAK